MKTFSLITALLLVSPLLSVMFAQENNTDITLLVQQADTEVKNGNEANALNLFEQVLTTEPNNLHANIFMGNYYFLKGESSIEEHEMAYKKISSPTKMQHADYRNKRLEIYNTYHEKAKKHLETVVARFSSVEAKRTLKKITLLKKEITK